MVCRQHVIVAVVLFNAVAGFFSRPRAIRIRREHIWRPHYAMPLAIEPFLARSMVQARQIPSLDDLKDHWEEHTENIRRPLMSHINILRVEMCWNRPNLMTHVKCLEFLGKTCAHGTTDMGICHEFSELVTDVCESMDLDDDWLKERTKEEESHLRHVHCDVAEMVNPDVLRPHKDHDGDNVENYQDVFPRDVTEWTDIDDDGIGDNTDPDVDGDGVENEKDLYPDNTTEWADMDGDGIGDNTDDDRDGDGYRNDQDVFPNDPSEWFDTDGDGIGDNSDRDNIAPNPAPGPAPAAIDSDGDGVSDSKEVFPNDPDETQDSDGDGHGDNSDVFPDDPEEWADSDGDGWGDNADEFPNDPNCHAEPCGQSAINEPEVVQPWHLNKVERGLPEQGYNEHSPEALADHNDMHTMTSDWRSERPIYKESEEHTLRRICERHPNNHWCGRYRVHGRFAR